VMPFPAVALSHCAWMLADARLRGRSGCRGERPAVLAVGDEISVIHHECMQKLGWLFLITFISFVLMALCTELDRSPLTFHGMLV
jgi:hypothetical protein